MKKVVSGKNLGGQYDCDLQVNKQVDNLNL